MASVANMLPKTLADLQLQTLTTFGSFHSRHGLHNAAGAAGAARRRSSFLQDKHSEDILAGIFSKVSRITARLVRYAKPALSLRAPLQLAAVHAGPRHWSLRQSRIRIPQGWPHQQTDTHEHRTFKIFDTNWMSAEEDPDTVSRLIEEDIDAKFVQEFHGDIAQAKKSAGHKVWQLVALSVARSDQRDPRLCFGQYNTERQCKGPDWRKVSQPVRGGHCFCHSGHASVRRSRPHQRRYQRHKSLPIRKNEWELLVVQHRGKLRFGAAWLSRMGAVLTRSFHQFLSTW